MTIEVINLLLKSAYLVKEMSMEANAFLCTSLCTNIQKCIIRSFLECVLNAAMPPFSVIWTDSFNKGITLV